MVELAREQRIVNPAAGFVPDCALPIYLLRSIILFDEVILVIPLLLYDLANVAAPPTAEVPASGSPGAENVTSAVVYSSPAY